MLLNFRTFLISLSIAPLSVLGQCSFTFTTSLTNITCNGGTNGAITVTATGGTSPYNYQLAEGSAGAWQTSNSFTGLAASTYPVSVKDATGCIKTSYVTITQPSALSIPYTTVDPTCSGSSNGTITIAPTGGVAPYTYSWTKNSTAFATTQNLTGLATANYQLVMTDANGCTASPAIAAQVRTVQLSGFNEDIVAEGTNTAASSATSRAIDQSPGNVYYASGYSNSNGTGSSGLPASGSFASAQDAARLYQLGSYSSNNALLLRSSTDNANGGSTAGNLIFGSPYQSPYSSLYVVGTTGSGTGTIAYTVKFSDSSSTTGSITFPDWALSASTASSVRALGGLDRVSRASPGAFDNGTNFNLFEAPITIAVGNQTKAVSYVGLTWSGSSSARTSVMAITGYTSTVSGIRINDGPASNGTASVTAVSDAATNRFCSGQSVVFTANPVNGGLTPSYQWKLNGTNVGLNSRTYTNSSLSNNDVVTVVMTASGGVSCLSSTTATSAPVTMTLATRTASVTHAASANPICSGSPVTFTATPTNPGITPVYVWKVNGTTTGLNSPVFTTSLLNNNDQVTVTMTSSIGCALSNPATSPAVTMTVNPVTSPTSAITAVRGVTFSSVITNGGATPGYQWYKNGSAISGATSSGYSTTTASVGDVFSMKLTSSYSCSAAPSAMSNYISMIAATLPVTLESFSAKLQKAGVQLDWITAAEQQNVGFHVQRATGSSAVFSSIGWVAAKGNNTAATYQFLDHPELSGTYRYRLMQEDRDGRQTASQEVLVRFASGAGASVIDQSGYWEIRSTIPFRYTLMDLQGRLMVSGKDINNYRLAKPVSAGLYLVTVQTDLEQQTWKVRK